MWCSYGRETLGTMKRILGTEERTWAKVIGHAIHNSSGPSKLHSPQFPSENGSICLRARLGSRVDMAQCCSWLPDRPFEERGVSLFFNMKCGLCSLMLWCSQGLPLPLPLPMFKDYIFVYLFMEAKRSEAYKEENNNLCSHHTELIMAALRLHSLFLPPPTF